MHVDALFARQLLYLACLLFSRPPDALSLWCSGLALWQHRLGIAKGAAALAASLLLCGPTLLPPSALAVPTSDVGRTVSVDRGSIALEIHRPSNMGQAQQLEQQQQHMDSSYDEPFGDVSSEVRPQSLRQRSSAARGEGLVLEQSMQQSTAGQDLYFC
eukprot:scaffold261437_cov19-Tisochrysis_lutea.AAC.1